MSALYEITGDYLRLLDMLEEGDEIDRRTILDTLEGIEGEFEEKADNYARIIRDLESEARKYKDEADRMQEKARALSNNGKKMRACLYESMKATEKTKFKTELFSFCIRKNGGKRPVRLIDGKRVPKRYMKMVPDDEAIREALESGEKLRFAVLEEHGDHLLIR